VAHAGGWRAPPPASRSRTLHDRADPGAGDVHPPGDLEHRKRLACGGRAPAPGAGWQRRSAAKHGRYDAIRGVIAELGADVIGLQEIGSPQSLETIFPPTEWDYVFSRGFGDDLAADPDKLASDTARDIYSAVVVRRSAATIVGTERIELDILHEDGHPAREGTAALIKVGRTLLWAVSLYLKSGCQQ
jgi:hypothetical protein